MHSPQAPTSAPDELSSRSQAGPSGNAGRSVFGIVLKALCRWIYYGVWFVTVLFVVAALAQITAHDAILPLVWVSSFTWYFYLPVYVLLLGAVLRRLWVLAVLNLLLVGCHLFWIAPDYAKASIPRQPAATNSTEEVVRIFSANVYSRNTAFAPMIREIRAADPDVVIIQEHNYFWQEAFVRARFQEIYPYQLQIPKEGNFGIAIFSKLPLEDAENWEIDGIAIARATLILPDAKLRLYSVHPVPPSDESHFRRWNDYWATVRKEISTETLPLVMLGDFNATQYSRWHKVFESEGLRSAHKDRGRGTATTWPNGKSWLPPIRIDHALISDKVECRQIVEGTGIGSDHQPIVVDLTVQ